MSDLLKYLSGDKPESTEIPHISTLTFVAVVLVIVCFAFGYFAVGGDPKDEAFTAATFPGLVTDSAEPLIDFIGGVILSMLVLWTAISVILRGSFKDSPQYSLTALVILFWMVLIGLSLFFGALSKQYEALGPGIAVGSLLGLTLGTMQVIRSPVLPPTSRGRQSQADEGKRPRYSVAIIFTCLTLIIIPIFVVTVNQLQELRESGTFTPESVLTLLLIFGVVTLLFVLLIFSAVFAVLGTANKNMALGLPPGSVRAVIALTFILVFVILGLFMFERLDDTKTRSYLVYDGDFAELREAYPEIQGRIVSVDPIQETDPEHPNATHKVGVEVEPANADARRNYATQMLTALATLVTAISSFYFATRATESDKPAEEEAGTPQVTGVEPGSIAANAKQPTLSIAGSNLASIKKVVFKLGDEDKFSQTVSAQENLIVVKDVELADAKAHDIVLIDANDKSISTGRQLVVTEGAG